MQNYRIKVSYLHLCFAAIFLLILCTLMTSAVRFSWIVGLSFAVNGCMWFALIFREMRRYRFSFVLTGWIFFFLFFFVAALVQYLHNDFPWAGRLNDDTVLEINIVLFVFSIFFLLGVELADRTRLKQGFFSEQIINLSLKKTVAILWVSFFIMIYRIYTVGFLNLFSRHTSYMEIEVSQAVRSLLIHGMNGFLCMGTLLLIYAWYLKRRKLFLYASVAEFLILFVSFSPFTTARFSAGAVYFSILIAIFWRKFQRSHVYSLLMLGGICFVLPLLNAFRNASFQEVDLVDWGSRLVSNFNANWLEGDYDAFAMIGMTMEYVDRWGHTWFHQLAGSLFFFVPRAFWPEKPLGSGYTVSSSLGYFFNNVSSPLPAEGLINFSWGG